MKVKGKVIFLFLSLFYVCGLFALKNHLLPSPYTKYTIGYPTSPHHSRCFLNLPLLLGGVPSLPPFRCRGHHTSTIIGSSFISANLLGTPPYQRTPFMTPQGSLHAALWEAHILLLRKFHETPTKVVLLTLPHKRPLYI